MASSNCNSRDPTSGAAGMAFVSVGMIVIFLLIGSGYEYGPKLERCQKLAAPLIRAIDAFKSDSGSLPVSARELYPEYSKRFGVDFYDLAEQRFLYDWYGEPGQYRLTFPGKHYQYEFRSRRRRVGRAQESWINNEDAWVKVYPE